VRSKLVASDPATFQLASGKNQLVEFFAFWSPMSNSMAPVMNGLEESYKDSINFLPDIDDPANALYKLLLGKASTHFICWMEGSVLNDWEGYVLHRNLKMRSIRAP
jgi:hypothetical protein